MNTSNFRALVSSHRATPALGDNRWKVTELNRSNSREPRTALGYFPYGWPRGIRTPDMIINSDLLCQLSYWPIWWTWGNLTLPSRLVWAQQSRWSFHNARARSVMISHSGQLPFWIRETRICFNASTISCWVIGIEWIVFSLKEEPLVTVRSHRESPYVGSTVPVSVGRSTSVVYAPIAEELSEGHLAEHPSELPDRSA